MIGKKKARRLVRSLRRFGELVDGHDELRTRVDGEDVDVTPFVCGMEVMAAYVDAVATGDVGPDNDPERLLRVLVSVAWNDWIDRAGEDGGDGIGGTGECESAAMRELLGTLDAMEGGDGDDAE